MSNQNIFTDVFHKASTDKVVESYHLVRENFQKAVVPDPRIAGLALASSAFAPLTEAARETLEQAGVELVYDGQTEIIVKDAETGKYELWFQNDGHASFGLTHNGHDYEFARSLSGQEVAQWKTDFDLGESRVVVADTAFNRVYAAPLIGRVFERKAAPKGVELTEEEKERCAACGRVKLLCVCDDDEDKAEQRRKSPAYRDSIGQAAMQARSKHVGEGKCRKVTGAYEVALKPEPVTGEAK